MPRFFSVSEVACQVGVPPRIISDLFYSRKLDDSRTVKIGSVRGVPEDYLPDVVRVLAENGKIPAVAKVV